MSYHNERISERFMKSAATAVLARAATIFISVIVVPVFGWAAITAYGSLQETLKSMSHDNKETALQVNQINSKLVAVDGAFNLLKSNIDNVNGTMNSRFDAQGRRIDKVVEDIDKLKDKVGNAAH